MAAGCATTVRVKDVRDAKDEHSEWSSFFFWGSVGAADIDIPTVCGPNRAAAAMGLRSNFGTGLLTFVTLGIYAPRVAYVSCGEPSSEVKP